MAIDAAACLEAGECMVMTKNIYLVFIAFAVLAAIFLLILFMVGFFTPAMIFLKAKFKKASLIYSVNRGQIGEFLIASGKFQGIADVKKVGPYIITENSHTLEKKSKIPFYFAFAEFASTLPLNFASLVQKLRERGLKITNVSDLAKLAGLKFDNETKVWKSIDEKDFTQKQEDIINEEITPYQTIKLHDLAYMFPFNITPALVESKIQHMLGLKQQMFNKMTPQFVMMFIMILMGATLAAVIAFKFLQTGDATGTVETRTIIERVVESSAIGNLSG